MKNLEKVFMVLAFLCALSSLIIAVYDHTSWAWQLISMMWMIIAYLKTVTIERNQNNNV
jgi:hypothetical protein